MALNITTEFWDFIEANVPNYYTRQDVLRQANLQTFIDQGDDTYVKGITREEAIAERDRILLRLYGEAIAAHTHRTPEQKALDDKLDEIIKNDAACDRLGEFIMEQVLNDTESYEKVGRYVIEAYQNGDPDAMVRAICGWGIQSLVEKTE